jgi:hypothetical protein
MTHRIRGPESEEQRQPTDSALGVGGPRRVLFLQLVPARSCSREFVSIALAGYIVSEHTARYECCKTEKVALATMPRLHHNSQPFWQKPG